MESAYDVNETEFVSTIVYSGTDKSGQKMAFPIPIFLIDQLKQQFDFSKELDFSGIPKKSRFLKGQIHRLNENSPFFGFAVEVVKVLDNDEIVVKFIDALFAASGRLMNVAKEHVGEIASTTGITTREAAPTAPHHYSGGLNTRSRRTG